MIPGMSLAGPLPRSKPLRVCVAAYCAVIRYGIAALIVVAALGKALDSSGLERVLRFNGIPEFLLPAASIFVFATELTIGTWMIVQRNAKKSLVAGIFIMIVFTLQIGWLLLGTDAPSCNCLGLWQSYHHARADNLSALYRNLLILLALCSAFVIERRLAGAASTRFHSG